MAESKEDKRRWALTLDAIDEVLEDEDSEPGERILAAIAWELMDIADTLDAAVNAGTKPTSRASGKSKPKPSDEEDE